MLQNDSNHQRIVVQSQQHRSMHWIVIASVRKREAWESSLQDICKTLHHCNKRHFLYSNFNTITNDFLYFKVKLNNVEHEGKFTRKLQEQKTKVGQSVVLRCRKKMKANLKKSIHYLLNFIITKNQLSKYNCVEAGQ